MKNKERTGREKGEVGKKKGENKEKKDKEKGEGGKKYGKI